MADAELIIFLVLSGLEFGAPLVALCYYFICLYRRRGQQQDGGGGQPRRPPGMDNFPLPTAEVAASSVAVVAWLDQVTYPRQNNAVSCDDDDDCAICLGTLEDGDLCSVMPGCRHEFNKPCIARWLKACNSTCPLCRAQLKWTAEEMV